MLALNTETAQMPAGGIGQIINAIVHKEIIMIHDEIIIAGGTNVFAHSDDLQESTFKMKSGVSISNSSMCTKKRIVAI